MQRALVIALATLAVGAAALVIMDIWGFDFGALLGKLLGTLAVLALLIGFLLVLKSDFMENKRLKDKGYLD